jgi:HSP20 family protein
MAELPGVKADEVQLHVENNILTLTGERKFDKEEKGEGYRRVERSYGSFTRSFALPNSVAGDQVQAEMNDGILTVKLPKKTEVQPRKIEVKSGRSPELKPGKPS